MDEGVEYKSRKIRTRGCEAKQDETRQVKVRCTKMSSGLNDSAVRERVQSGRGAFNVNATADWIHSLLSSYDDLLNCDAALFRIKLPAPE